MLRIATRASSQGLPLVWKMLLLPQQRPRVHRLHHPAHALQRKRVQGAQLAPPPWHVLLRRCRWEAYTPHEHRPKGVPRALGRRHLWRPRRKYRALKLVKHDSSGFESLRKGVMLQFWPRKFRGLSFSFFKLLIPTTPFHPIPPTLFRLLVSLSTALPCIYRTPFHIYRFIRSTYLVPHSTLIVCTITP